MEVAYIMSTVRARGLMCRLVSRAGMVGLVCALALTPAYGQTCTSTIPDIERRCRDAILVHKYRTQDAEDRLGVCMDDKRDLAEDNEYLRARPAPPSDFWPGFGVGAGTGAAAVLGVIVYFLVGK